MDPVAAVQDPGGQSRHVARAPTGLYEPGEQGMGAADPIGHRLPSGHGAVVAGVAQKEPAAHKTHVVFVTAPVAGEYMPLGQDFGAVDDAGQYVPAGQTTLVAGVAQKEPAAQAAPAVERPAGQKVELAQGVGAVDDAGQKLPAGHVTLAAGVAQNEPAAHGMHVETELAPIVDENVPLAQDVGAVEDAAQKLPAGQATLVDGVAQYEPAAQGAAVELPATQYVELVHGVGAVDDAGQ